MIKVLLVRDPNSCNIPYLIYCTFWLKRLFLIDFTEVSVRDYVTFDQSSFDIVIYATFCDETAPQFAKTIDIIPQTDEKFLNFKRTKILFDSHDHGNLDSFPRFAALIPHSYTSIPRIKTAPHQDYLQKYNVVLATTYPLGLNPLSPSYYYWGNWTIAYKNTLRDIDISYRVNIDLKEDKQGYRRSMREKILELVKDYQVSRLDFTIDTEYIPKDPNYKSYLSRVLISVCPPGHGPGTFRHLESLNARNLMFSHDSIDPIKLLPHADLIEGEDYISFNFDNFAEKLDYLLGHRQQIGEIAKRGYNKFQKGYSIKRSTLAFYQILRQLA